MCAVQARCRSSETIAIALVPLYRTRCMRVCVLLNKSKLGKLEHVDKDGRERLVAGFGNGQSSPE